jgi:hypothetical protein
MTWRAEVDSTFDRARRKEAYRRFSRIVTRRQPPDLPYLEAIRTRFRLFDQSYVGIRSIRVADIVGTIDRSSAFAGDFLPRRAQMRERWQQVERAFPQGEFPPISVYQLGERYYVTDGRHRVAIAKQRKAEFIDAEVTRLHARFEIPVDADIGGLILREQERIFMDESGLERACPEARILFTRPQGYIELLELVKVHGYDLALSSERLPEKHEVAGDWYDRVYLPTVEAIRREGLTQVWPDATDADLFLLVWQRRRSLFPERGATSLEDAAKSARAESPSGRTVRSRAQARLRTGRPAAPPGDD